MNLHVQSTMSLTGQVLVPSSKSQSIRALLLALLAPGTSTLSNLLVSDDTHDATSIVQALGADTIVKDHQLLLTSSGYPLTTTARSINTGNSGITTHFVMPLLGLRKHADHEIILDCGEQMRARPIHELVNTLRTLGLTISYLKKENMLPIAVSGKLLGGDAEVNGITSQYISALLVALPCAPNTSHITVKNLHERSYMQMTLEWLDQQQIDYSHQHSNDTDIFIIKGQQHYKKFSTTISGDFSSASYLIAAGVLLSGTIELTGLNMDDSQADKRLVTILQDMGADIIIHSDRLIIHGGKILHGTTIDANDIPDLLPTLAVIGTQAIGKTTIVNVPHARIKETDRIHSMTQGLTRLGAKIEEHPDGMTIHQSSLTGAQVDGYGDHRTVMALSLAGLLASGETIIEGCEAINKTFPAFITLMRALGANMEVHNEHA